ncbi:MAG: nitroreductase family protein [Planctomycetota bacterium]|nr:nitroreductase family protein [Planctomycetota bacterium]
MNDKTTIERNQLIRAVDFAIKNRQTQKIIANKLTAVLLEPGAISELDQSVKDSIAISGWAPFHYDRKKDQCAEPWRFTLFFHQQCRELSQEFHQIFSNIKPTNKIPGMLRACGALVLITWLPETDSESEKIRQVNEEHLAAAAAATQNLLLALEARGLGTYWSSGGLLGSETLFKRYGIDPGERLISAIFVNYPGLYSSSSSQVHGGKNRDKRASWMHWTRIID